MGSTSISVLLVVMLSFAITSRYSGLEKTWFHNIKRNHLIMIVLVLAIILTPLVILSIKSLPMNNNNIEVYIEEIVLSAVFLLSSFITWKILSSVIIFISQLFSPKDNDQLYVELFRKDLQINYPLSLVSDLYTWLLSKRNPPSNPYKDN